MLLKFVSFALCLSFSLGFVQEIMLYTEPDAGGSGLIFRTKEPDLTQHQFILRDVKSFCSRGYWRGFSGVNYSIAWSFNHHSRDGELHCENAELPATMSLRYSGPADASTPSVSIYSGTLGTITGNVERTFTSISETNFGFVPTWMVITGGSSWTGFANEDFTGNSTCFTSSYLLWGFDLRNIEVRSIVKGCDARYGSAYYDEDASMGL
ncbi:uncharacterized protein LOC110858934 [Folsomia candida]|uniref:uncharacterized protein LOC110858934 n=1 Tax=Folsomia candida TaxID=158441 RepID=UPI000B9066E5|nr:uncharacterized protein LOC110858934 [Folsomia candida]